jgi:hypothetical protein
MKVSLICVIEDVWLPFWLAFVTVYRFYHHFVRIKFQCHIIRLCKNSECSLDSVMQMKHHFMFNPLNAKLNPICHLLAVLGAHLIFHVNTVRVNGVTHIIAGSIFWLPNWVLQSREHHQSLYSSDVVCHTVNRMW